jgi:hypothetical protein
MVLTGNQQDFIRKIFSGFQLAPEWRVKAKNVSSAGPRQRG